MKRANDFAGLVLRICGCIALVVFTLALAAVLFVTLQLRQDIDDVTNNFIGVAEHLVVIEKDLDDTVNDVHGGELRAFTEINRPCKGKDCGLLASADKLLIKGQDVIVTTQLNEDREAALLNVELPNLMGRVSTTVDQAQGTLAAYEKTGETLTLAANGLLPVESNAALTLKDADSVVVTAGSIAKHGDAVMSDVQFEADKIAHPPKKKLTFWGAVYAGAKAAHQFEPPLF